MDDNDRDRKPGVGLALSGGGFRATLFHLGSLWRLNELGYLKNLSEVTSVSGGSVTAGLVGLRWNDLVFETNIALNFTDLIAKPLRDFCSHTIDVGSVLGGIINPFVTPGQLVIDKYKKHLYGTATLQDLPDDSRDPRFTIYSTSMQTGASVRLSKPYLGEYHLGLLRKPDISLAEAVAASSAFPPPLCPVKLTLDAARWENVEGADLHQDAYLKENLYLEDGGVYDNLGLERLWDTYQTILVSDAGAPFEVDRKVTASRWSQLARTKRTLDIISEQTRALRVRRVIQDYIDDVMEGAYWGIATQIDKYHLENNGLPPPLVHDNDLTASLSKIRTRLNKFSPEEQGHLINWGYALTDAAMRRYVLEPSATQGQWPLPEYAL